MGRGDLPRSSIGRTDKGSYNSLWSVLTLLIAFIASTYIVDGKTQQSAYGDDWDDLGDFRSEINSMGVKTTAMVSSPPSL